MDLIVCFDGCQKNPSRLVQRMGRTGRKRTGQIYILVTDGKEYKVRKYLFYTKTKNEPTFNCYDKSKENCIDKLTMVF